jgi:CDP-diacylglycerol--glycerol-3-phosphate 3-phosphatidyltransferase
LFVIGAMTDFWDGWIARRHHLETPFGQILDPLADKIFILATMVSFAVLGVYSYWFLVPIFLREIAVTFSRSVWLYQGQAIGAERSGKLKLVLQVVSVLSSFLYLGFPSRPIFFLNHAFLIAALFMTLYSGFFFFKNNARLIKDPNFLRWVAAMGVGYLRPFPGTYGSLLGLAVIPVVIHHGLLHLLTFFIFLLVAYLAIPRLGLREEEDPLEIVIDEFCGILLCFFAVPLRWESLVIGFVLFRFFDVTKIFPINWLEKRKGVHGIMLDDLGAGIYTWLILKLIFR